MEPCKIIKFVANNFKKLSAVEITPESQVVVLTGENGAGKSAILDGIEATIVGKRSVPEEPIKHGSTRGDTEVTLDNGLVVSRNYTPGGSKVTIRDSANKLIGSPQAVLDTMIKSLAFDPLEFARMKDDAQNEVLRQLVGLDTSDIDKETKTAYDARTEVNREVDRIAAQLPLFPPAPEGTPDAELSLQDTLAELNNVQGRNKQVEELNRNANYAEAAARDELARQEDAKRELEAAQKKLEDCTRIAAEAVSKAAALRQTARREKLEDEQPVREKLANLEITNKAVRNKISRLKLESELASKRAESQRLTDKLAELNTQKQARLQAVKYPLPGLELTPTGIRYNGSLFSQASDGEKLRISVAMGMAMNPTLKVIFIRDGSLLDQKGLALVAQMAAENNCQVWLEDARSTDPAAIVIEAGEVSRR